MRNPTIALLCLGLVSVSLPAQRRLPPPSALPCHHLIEVELKDVRHLARLLRLDLDLAGCRYPEAGVKRVEVIATDLDVETLRRAGFGFRVMQLDLEAHYEAELRRRSLGRPETLTPPLGQGAMGGHYTLAQIEAIVDSFASKFPTLCSQKVSIGKSVENRDIWMVKISDNVNVDENEPEVFYDALHHAREPLSMEATLLFMDELLDGYGKDPEATFIIDQRELYFVPCVNPDGYEYNRSTQPNGGGMWRKNRRPNVGGSYGVDLNRNYATAWSAPNGGSSTSPTSSTYRGTAAFSEPETQAIENFVKTRQFVQVNSCHTYAEVLLQPWGYQNGVPANNADYSRLTARLLSQNPMRSGPASTELYIAAGTALDHHHTAWGAYSWTPELGTSAEGGFWPAGQTIIDIARRHQPMFRAIALTSGALLGVDSVKLTELTGNGNGAIEPGEVGALVLQVRNDGAAATTGAAAVQLSKVTNGIIIGNGSASLGTIARFGNASNTTALTFSVPGNFSGLVIELEVTLVGDGSGTRFPVPVVLAPMRTAVVDDMEVDRGSRRAPGGTASTGLWERAAPQQTTNNNQPFQPGSQHTPAGSLCWVTDGRAGTSAGTYDVDGGFTDLVTPVLDLAHMRLANLEFFRWYAESVGDDPFVVSVSRDGGQQWTDMFSSAVSTVGWAPFNYPIPAPLTATMQFRMRAQDLKASLVEAAVDDLAIRGVTDAGNLTALSSGAIGSTLQLGLNGDVGGNSMVLLSASKPTGSGISVPGIAGRLAFDPAAAFIFGRFGFGPDGFTAVEIVIPNVPGLSGTTIYWQTLYTSGSQARFGNVQATAVR